MDASTLSAAEAEAATAAIDVRAVTKRFGTGAAAVLALDAVSLAVGENAFFTLLGPSGCGKTTLLRLIAGFEAPSAGTIALRGRDITGLAPHARPVNTVFQSYALFPHMSVAENIGFGLRMLGRPKAEIRATVAEMLALVRMEALADRRTDQISGGQQQRVALARALAPRPSVLLLDEPLSALDFKLRKEMQGELKRLQHETGITFLFVTHDQEEALTMSDRIAVMSEGRILQLGTPREIYDRPRTRFVAEFVGETNLLTAEVLGREPGGVRLRLGALDLRASGEGAVGTRVTVAIRPEHLRLGAPGEGLAAQVTEVTYFGTDTVYDLALPDGTALRARVQNRESGAQPLAPGASVGLGIAPGSAQVLADG